MIAAPPDCVVPGAASQEGWWAADRFLCCRFLNPLLPPMWVHLDSNQGPAGYEPDALTAELWTRKIPGAQPIKSTSGWG